MATSDSGDEKDLDNQLQQPMRKKRKAAQPADAVDETTKFQDFGSMYNRGRGAADDDEESEESSTIERHHRLHSDEKTKRTSESSQHHQQQQRPARTGDEGDSGHEHDDDQEVEDENDEDDDTIYDDSDEDFDSEDIEGEEDPIEKSSTSASKSVRKERKRRSTGTTTGTGTTNELYDDFAPPLFLEKILAKRRREMDRIRRQLPVDSRSREQKLSDWYKMLSKLDKPVALLSLISPPLPTSHHGQSHDH